MLPTGYAGMIVLALVPPVWRRVMDPRVLAHFDGELTRANLQPGKRDKILARYGTRVTAAEDKADTRGDARRAACARAAVTSTTRSSATRARASPAGTPWSAIPVSWCCPDCGVREKVDFVAPGRVGA